MNRIKFVYSVALTHAFFVTLCFVSSSIGQDVAIIKALPEIPDRVSNRLVFQEPVPQLDRSVRSDQQESASDRVIQGQDSGNKRFRNLDESALQKALGDELLAQFKEGEWPLKELSTIDLDVRDPSDNVPIEIAGRLVNSLGDRWADFNPAPKMYCWAAPNIRYQPLYFEDVPLERYGQTKGTTRQTIRSGVHFFTSIALLPYHMHHDRPGSCDYPLGFCRPGDCVPYTIQRQLYPHSAH